MKEKLISIKDKLSKKNKSRYGWLFSIVALVEVAMILIVSTYSWVETISSIEITNSAGKVDDYTYTNALVGTGEGYSGQPINLSKYFRASGNVHMASASSKDGREFFFPQLAKTGTTENNYRQGNINDKNTNYISFSFKVTAKGTAANFYFSQVPTFKIGDTVVSDNKVRIALTVSNEDGTESVTKVYSNTEAKEEVVANISGTPKVTTSQIYAFSDYDNKDDDEANVLFSILKEKTKLVTLTAWLQDPEKTEEYAGKALTCDNGFQIVTAVKNTKINFVDRTSAFNSADATSSTWNWVGNDVGNDAAILWLKTSQGAFKMQKVETSDTTAAPTWTITIPSDDLGASTDDLYFYRTASTVTSNPQDNHNNFWKTKLSEASAAEVPTYKAYGNLKPGSEKEGYGTWGKVCEIKVLGDGVPTLLPTPSDPDTATQITVTTKNSASVVPMNYNDGYWRVFIPNDANSADLTISFSGNTIDAVNRDTSEDASTFNVTSKSTGYWEPASIVEVKVATGYENMGKISVSGGPEGETSVKVTKGTTVTLKATANLLPGSEDYAFEGWYNDDACTSLLSHNSEQPYTAAEKKKKYTFYARFQYNVRLTAVTDDVEENNDGGSVQINDGTAGAKVNLYVKKGGSVTLKAVQTAEQAEDYTFMGWRNSENTEVYPATQTTIEITDLQKPINLFAVYKVKEYTLEAYALNGGNAEFWIDDTQKESGAHITITATNKQTVVYKAVADDSSGYEFVGWYEDEACSKLKTTETNFIANKNTDPKTYYAKFQLKKYNMTARAVTNGTVYSDKGGTVQVITDLAPSAAAAAATASEKATHGTTATFVAIPKNGYSFVGWYDKASAGTKISSDLSYAEEGVASDKTYYAIFKQKFTVSLTARTDGAISSAGGTVQAGSSTAGSTSSATVLYGENITIKALVSSAKYSFIGWFDSSNAEQGSEATKTLTSVKSNTTLYADFKVKTFTITAIAVSEGTQGSAGGTVEFTSPVATSGATATVTVDYDGSATFKATVKDSDGYEFKGWFNNSAMTGDAAFNTPEFTLNNITDDTVKTYYAKFDLKQYTVTANAITTGTATSGGGTVVQVVNGTEQTASDIVNINNVKHGSQITLRANPVSGATFLGWYDAETEGNPLADTTDYTPTITNNTQVYARFKVSGKTIYFKPNDGWKADSARFAAYMWTGSGGAGSEKWYDLTDDDGDGTYCFTSTNSWTKIIFARMNPSKTENNFKDGVCWNKTGDLDVPSDSDNPCYTITKGPSGGTEGTWGTYTPVEYVSVNLGAVSINSRGGTQSNGFTGGSITVGTNTYTSATVLKYKKDSSFSATATATGNYVFKGWFDNPDCSGDALSADTLSATLSENKTYYAKFVEQPVEQSNVTITFVDATNNKWVSGASATLFVFDNSTNNYYPMTNNNNNTWTASVPVSVTNITFYRCTPDGFNTGDKGETYRYWNIWEPADRGTKTTFNATDDGKGNWK